MTPRRGKLRAREILWSGAVLLAVLGGEARLSAVADASPSPENSELKRAKSEAKRWADEADRKLKAQREKEELEAKRRVEAAHKAEEERLAAQRKAELEKQRLAQAERRRAEAEAKRWAKEAEAKLMAWRQEEARLARAKVEAEKEAEKERQKLKRKAHLERERLAQAEAARAQAETRRMAQEAKRAQEAVQIAQHLEEERLAAQRKAELEKERLVQAERQRAESEAKRWAKEAEERLKDRKESELLEAKRQAETARRAQLERERLAAKERQKQAARQAEAARLAKLQAEAEEKAGLERQRIERETEREAGLERRRLAKIRQEAERQQNREAQRLEDQLKKSWQTQQAARAKAQTRRMAQEAKRAQEAALAAQKAEAKRLAAQPRADKTKTASLETGSVDWKRIRSEADRKEKIERGRAETEAKRWAEEADRKLKARQEREAFEARARAEEEKRVQQGRRRFAKALEQAQRLADRKLKEERRESQPFADEGAPKEKEGVLGKIAGFWSSATGTVSSRKLPQEAYHLRLGDKMEVTVLGYGGLTQTVEIAENGTFLFPLTGTVKAAGRSLKEVEQELEERLSRRYQSETLETEWANPAASGRILSPGEAVQQAYRLRLGDQITISVWGHTDLGQTVPIREDGTLSFPLIGPVAAAGRTLREVEEAIQERLSRDFVVSPQVTAQLKGASFSILGEVEKPGVYLIEGSTDLLAALGQAGEVATFGGSRVEVIRGEGDQKVTIRVDTDEVLQGREPSLAILPHDTLYVRRLLFSKIKVSIKLADAKFYVFGEVGRPGTFPYGDTIDLLTAISEAGGITKFGSHTVQIVRKKGTQKVRIRANVDNIIQGKEPNVNVMPHDTIYVGKSLF